MVGKNLNSKREIASTNQVEVRSVERTLMVTIRVSGGGGNV
jgi:hypothetical protein